jgi:hypothetical protein
LRVCTGGLRARFICCQRVRVGRTLSARPVCSFVHRPPLTRRSSPPPA